MISTLRDIFDEAKPSPYVKDAVRQLTRKPEAARYRAIEATAATHAALVAGDFYLHWTQAQLFTFERVLAATIANSGATPDVHFTMYNGNPLPYTTHQDDHDELVVYDPHGHSAEDDSEQP